MTSKLEDRMRAQAFRALDDAADLNVEGFESSRVFALTRQVIENPPAGSPISRKRLLRRVGAIILFIVHPTQPLDPSNPRTRPTKTISGGGIRPAYWFLDLKKTGKIGKGQPPTTILGRKRKADVVIECIDRDLVDIAAGRTFASKVYNTGRMKIKGSLDSALSIADLFNHERAKIYGTVSAESTVEGDLVASPQGREQGDEYSDGMPAPVTVDIKSKL